MKSEELRIGNYVFPLDQGGEELDIAHKVTLISRNYVGVTFTTEVNRAYIEIKPILLTEEWLLKFNFLKEGNTFKMNDVFSISHSFRVKNGNLLMELEPVVVNVGNLFCRTLLYVHELQNLYYILTDEELTINEI